MNGLSSRMSFQVSGMAGDETLCVSISPPNLLRAIPLTRHVLPYFCSEDPFLSSWSKLTSFRKPALIGDTTLDCVSFTLFQP